MLMLLNNVRSEIKQLRGTSAKEYFKSFFNYVDLIQVMMTALLILNILLELDILPRELQIVLSSISSFLLLLKIYDWLRLFEQTAFFVKLVMATLSDIVPFMIVFDLSMSILAVPMAILNLNKNKAQDLVPEYFGWWLIDSLFNQYLLALGTFDTLEHINDHSWGWLTLLFFIVATFFTQIMLFNMIIAIMGDTFSNAMEMREVNGIRMKLTILGEQAPLLSQRDKKDQDKIFMFVARPVEEEGDDDDNWNGQIQKITSITKKQIGKLIKDMKKMNGLSMK